MNKKRLTRAEIAGCICVALVWIFVLVSHFCAMMKEPGICPGFVHSVEHVEFEVMNSGTFEATGYAIGPPYASIVKSGQPVVNKGFMSLGDMELFTVAVDPRVIPLGSVLWLEGLGLGMATDTGTDIKGRRIDVCFRTMTQACRFGRRDVNVVMLRSGS